MKALLSFSQSKFETGWCFQARVSLHRLTGDGTDMMARTVSPYPHSRADAIHDSAMMNSGLKHSAAE